MCSLIASATNPNLGALSLANEHLNRVVEKMGALGQFSVTEYDPNPINMHNKGIKNQMRIGEKMADVLNGGNTEFTVQSALGLMAHEVAHRILKHNEQTIAFLLESQGIPVKSLDDLVEVLSGTPETQSAKRLFIDYHNWASGETPESVEKLINSVNQKISEFYRNQEKEADLLTMRDSYLARGLRDYFVRIIENCEKNPEFHCSVSYVDDEKHPSTVSRIHYMTRALCQEYPEENSDICPDTDSRYGSYTATA